MRRRLLIFTLIALAAVTNAAAQTATATAPYKFDFGGSVGLSGYIGEANASNPFSSAGFTADLAARYIIDTRWALRGALTYASLSGSTEGMANVLPGNTVYSFSSSVFDLSVRGEVNFFSFGIGETYKRLRRISPYLAVGVGLSLASCDGNTAIAPSLPMAFGVRYKLKERLNIYAEFSMTKIFSDKVDGNQLLDLNGIKTNFVKNTDWVSRIAVGVTYEFGKRCETCHYVD